MLIHSRHAPAAIPAISAGSWRVRAGSTRPPPYLTEWLTHIRQHVRPSTYAGYESNVRLHLIPRIGKKKLARLTVRDIRLMIDAMRADGKGTRSIQYVHATLRAALEHACREEIIPRNVARLVRIEAPTPLRSREPLTIEEARKLLAAVHEQPHGARR
jgi:integrase